MIASLVNRSVEPAMLMTSSVWPRSPRSSASPCPAGTWASEFLLAEARSKCNRRLALRWFCLRRRGTFRFGEPPVAVSRQSSKTEPGNKWPGVTQASTVRPADASRRSGKGGTCNTHDLRVPGSPKRKNTIDLRHLIQHRNEQFDQRNSNKNNMHHASEHNINNTTRGLVSARRRC